ncbi:hypothetical protein COB57_04015 [Candidatus Peregrinibacteria bacterium]|nr:MAG: hypothetical protein COB57_04015 [Candidatus Peregrinibacteria bacterium]
MDYYTLDRKNVASMLDVSLRTLDRYISKKMFSTKKKKGKVFFHEAEIVDYIQERNVESVDVGSQKQSTRLRQTQEWFDEEVSQNNHGENMAKDMSFSHRMVSQDIVAAEIHQKMYETINDLYVAQQKDLNASYKYIGELEYKIQESTRLLATAEVHAGHQEDLEKQVSQLSAQAGYADQKLEKMSSEVLLKRIYFTLFVVTVFSFSLLFALTF